MSLRIDHRLSASLAQLSPLNFPGAPRGPGDPGQGTGTEWGPRRASPPPPPPPLGRTSGVEHLCSGEDKRRRGGEEDRGGGDERGGERSGVGEGGRE